MTDQDDTPSPANKIKSLFPGVPSAAPIPVQPELVARLSALLDAARQGEIIGVAYVVYGPQGNSWLGTEGKLTNVQTVAGLEQLKFIQLMQWSQQGHASPDRK